MSPLTGIRWRVLHPFQEASRTLFGERIAEVFFCFKERLVDVEFSSWGKNHHREISIVADEHFPSIASRWRIFHRRWRTHHLLPFDGKFIIEKLNDIIWFGCGAKTLRGFGAITFETTLSWHGDGKITPSTMHKTTRTEPLRSDCTAEAAQTGTPTTGAIPQHSIEPSTAHIPLS